MSDSLPFHQDRIWYGGDYNPEQWPEQVWEEDVRLMVEAGVTAVSLGIFAWARLEPRPGVYEFAWLDRVIELLHSGGIQVCLATATASPPPWLAKHHPESLPVTADGVTLWPGGRQHYCPSSLAYRDAAARLVRQIAERYGNHPALALWHINNEYACHVQECFCERCAVRFRAWLQARYADLDALNAAWGTAFWSQRYDAWDEVLPPRRAPTFANPTQQLDWRRFSSDNILELFEQERAILRELTPDVPVTTNFLGFWKPLNYWRWAAREDVVAHDCYPDPNDPTAHIDAAMSFDLMRSLRGGQPWLLMEQTPSAVNWRPQNSLKRPGQMRQMSLQAVARGANGVMFFQWRASRAGAEKFHGALVPHVGTERSRVFSEVSALGAELKSLAAVLPARERAAVAIMLDWESWWALEQDSKPSTSLQQLELIRRWYEPLFRRNIAVDFVGPDSALDDYRVVLLPNLYMLHENTARRIEALVAAGGVVAVGFFSGIVDEHEHVYLGGYPAPLRPLLGIRVEEFEPYPLERRNGLRLADGTLFGCDLWSDLLDLEGAEALATYTDDFYAGRPAITRHRFGQGSAFYVGTRLDAAGADWLIGELCAAGGVQPPLVVPDGVEAVRRGRLLFLLNHRGEPVELPIPAGFTAVAGGAEAKGSLSLERFGVTVLQEN
jgi:beta-galactosidase